MANRAGAPIVESMVRQQTILILARIVVVVVVNA